MLERQAEIEFAESQDDLVEDGVLVRFYELFDIRKPEDPRVELCALGLDCAQGAVVDPGARDGRAAGLWVSTMCLYLDALMPRLPSILGYDVDIGTLINQEGAHIRMPKQECFLQTVSLARWRAARFVSREPTTTVGRPHRRRKPCRPRTFFSCPAGR